MIYSPDALVKKDGAFRFLGNISATANTALTKPVIAEFWNGFCFHLSTLETTETDELIFAVGDAATPITDGKAYAINVEPSGIRIAADDRKGLIMGLMTLMDRIETYETKDGIGLKIDCFELKESPAIKNRMAHFCVFPEVEVWEIQKFLRLCAALRYSHVIVEFWGMLKYDCLDSLSWPQAYTKDQIRPIFDEARDLGLELIPMFNCWGHAAACRGGYGKHVVLDQNPELQYLFTDSGWSWNIYSPKAKELLRKIRDELIDLCGEGEYFHVGCDESFCYDLKDKQIMDDVCAYINEMSAEITAKGRRAIVWGDMFLYRYPEYKSKNGYPCFCPSPESEQYMLSKLDKNIIIGNWQYYSEEAPHETTPVFVKAGLDNIICGWDRSEANIKSCMAVARKHDLVGYMHTTWHTLPDRMWYLAIAGIACFDGEGIGNIMMKTASLLRKVYFTDGDYLRSGWMRRDVQNRL